jgi:F-type H+-transporting ATPase subunit b
MEVLQSLGINSTVFYQFAIFAVTLLVLMNLVFKPFAEACEQRESKTKGSVDNVASLEADSQALYQKYETEARQVTGEIKKIFDLQREQGRKEAEGLTSRAKEEAVTLVTRTRKEVETPMQSATAQAQGEIPQLVQAMVNKLLA